jgi:hypothetical protein
MTPDRSLDLRKRALLDLLEKLSRVELTAVALNLSADLGCLVDLADWAVKAHRDPDADISDSPRESIDELDRWLKDYRVRRPEPPHIIDWFGTFRGTDEDPREMGWCATCEREVYDGENANHRSYGTTESQS